MEQAAARKEHGPASTGWPEDNQKQWKIRYEKLHKQILSERDRLRQEKQEQEKKTEKIKEQHEKKTQRAEEAVKKIKDHESKAYQAAQEALASGSQYFKKEMLSEYAQIRVLKASGGIGICSKCHWSSGCLECSGKHAFKYHMSKGALSKGMMLLLLLLLISNISDAIRAKQQQKPMKVTIFLCDSGGGNKVFSPTCMKIINMSKTIHANQQQKINEHDQIFGESGGWESKFSCQIHENHRRFKG